MRKRAKNWTFGSGYVSDEEKSWYVSHEPAVDRWLTELEAAGDEWWVSAEHAARCLVSHRIYETLFVGQPLDWQQFDVASFLFEDLWNGGTVGIFGSVPIFFDHLVEAFRRFILAGLVNEVDGARWLLELVDARDDFLRCFDEATGEPEALLIARRRCA